VDEQPYFTMQVGFSDQVFHDQFFKKEGGWKGQMKDPHMWGRAAATAITGRPTITALESEPLWNDEGNIYIYETWMSYRGYKFEKAVYASTVTNVSRDKVPGAVGAGCVRVDYNEPPIFFYSLGDTRFKYDKEIALIRDTLYDWWCRGRGTGAQPQAQPQVQVQAQPQAQVQTQAPAYAQSQAQTQQQPQTQPQAQAQTQPQTQQLDLTNPYHSMKVGFSDEKKFRARKLLPWSEKGRIDFYPDRLIYVGKKQEKTIQVTMVSSVERANPSMFGGQDFGISCVRVVGTEPLYFYSTRSTRHKEQEEINQIRDYCMDWWQRGKSTYGSQAQVQVQPQHEQSGLTQQPYEGTQHQSACPSCGQAASFVAQYKKYYCYACKKYL
jgi:hypothetical protein